jgi:hypothetical protein
MLENFVQAFKTTIAGMVTTVSTTDVAVTNYEFVEVDGAGRRLQSMIMKTEFTIDHPYDETTGVAEDIFATVKGTLETAASDGTFTNELKAAVQDLPGFEDLAVDGIAVTEDCCQLVDIVEDDVFLGGGAGRETVFNSWIAAVLVAIVAVVQY